MSPLLAFVLGYLFGMVSVGVTMVLAMRLTTQGSTGLPLVGKPTARKLPEEPDAELVLRRKLRQNAINRGADDILERAKAQGIRVTPDQARQAAADALDATGFEV